MADEEFDSSDIEFTPRPKKSAIYDDKCIARVVASTHEYRVSTKITVKSLEFGRGAPGTRDVQRRWVGRLDRFRTDVLRQSISDPFTGDDLIRFFDAMLGVIRTNIKDRPAPSFEMFKNALDILLNYGKFTYNKDPRYNIDGADGERLETFFDNAVRDGRLMKGTWQKKESEPEGKKRKRAVADVGGRSEADLGDEDEEADEE